MQYSEWSALDIVHKVLKDHIKPGMTVIDATCGNGYDTVFLAGLVGESGKVLAVDIQESAVLSTINNLKENNCDKIAKVICMSHSDIDKISEENTADAVVFNFGWLPGGSHDIYTRAETSIPAIEKALKILKPGGMLSLCLYYGRNNGYSERDAIIDYVTNLDCRYYAVMKCDFLNRKNDPPFPVFVVKEKE